ncbi:hypothetical protein VEE57_44730 (plasmid) [Escherichia coli]|nr:hypothetical protein VEE57_44730 [Escherichia coli]
MCNAAELVRGSVAETLKYSTKPADMVADPDWFLELTRLTHKRRFVASGGALKDVLKLEQETDQDMVFGDDISDGEDDGSRHAFGGDSTPRKYDRCLNAIRLNQILIRVSGPALTTLFWMPLRVAGLQKHILSGTQISFGIPSGFLRFPLCIHTRIHE